MATWLNGSPGGLAEPSELPGTTQESFADDNIAASVQLICPWANRHAVMNNMLLGPTRWPYFDGVNLFAASGSIVPMAGEAGTKFGSENQFYNYTNALLTVNFEPLEVSPSGDPGDVTIYSESFEPNAEFITLPPDDFRWGSAEGTALKTGEAPGKLIIGFDYVLTLFGLTSVPAWALSLTGKCNSDTVVSPSLGMSFAAQTLLFNPPKISRNVTIGGDNSYTLATRFSGRATGWNKFWRPSTGDYEFMYHVDGGGSPYLNFPTASFAGVLP